MGMPFAQAMRLVAGVAIAFAISACASPSTNQLAGISAPGSSQDFVVNVGDRIFTWICPSAARSRTRSKPGLSNVAPL